MHLELSLMRPMSCALMVMVAVKSKCCVHMQSAPAWELESIGSTDQPYVRVKR